MTQAELRCAACRRSHPHRKPPLLAVIHGTALLVPRRLGRRTAAAAGLARSGLYWDRLAPDRSGCVRLSCRRCPMTTVRPLADLLSLPAGSVGYLDASTAMTAAAR